MRNLSRNEAITVAAVVLAAVLSVIGHIVVREWYAPNLRYEVGEFYQTSDSWITALRLENYGRQSADDVMVSVLFPTGIIEQSVGSFGVQVDVEWDGPGTRVMNLLVPRIVPGQSVYLFFNVEPPADVRLAQSKEYVQSIVHAGGMAEEGAPTRGLLRTLLIGMLMGALSGWAVGVLMTRHVSREIDAIRDSQRVIEEANVEMSDKTQAIAFAHEIVGEIVNLVDRNQTEGEEVSAELVEILTKYRDQAAEVD